MEINKVVEELEAVLCDPEGNVSIMGSEQDYIIIRQCLDKIKTFLSSLQSAEMPTKITKLTRKELTKEGIDYYIGFNHSHDLWLAYHLKKMGERVDVERIEKIIKEFILFEYQEGKYILSVEFQDFIKNKPDFFEGLAQAIQSELLKKE